jgi:hypothetical protein
MFDSKQHTRLSPEVGSKWVQIYKKNISNVYMCGFFSFEYGAFAILISFLAILSFE